MKVGELVLSKTSCYITDRRNLNVTIGPKYEVTRCPIFNGIVLSLGAVSCCPNKDKMECQIVFFPTEPFYLEVTRNFMLHTQFISGTWVEVTCSRFASCSILWYSDYIVSHGGV
jgi:hypothetical protein